MWDQLLGPNHIVIKDHREVPATIARIILEKAEQAPVKEQAKQSTEKKPVKVEEPTPML
jgi:hypothetical protein